MRKLIFPKDNEDCGLFGVFARLFCTFLVVVFKVLCVFLNDPISREVAGITQRCK